MPTQCMSVEGPGHAKLSESSSILEFSTTDKRQYGTAPLTDSLLHLLPDEQLHHFVAAMDTVCIDGAGHPVTSSHGIKGRSTNNPD